MFIAFARYQRRDSGIHAGIHIGRAEVAGVGQSLRRHADLILMLFQ
jgi:hypothetical protein